MGGGLNQEEKGGWVGRWVTYLWVAGIVSAVILSLSITLLWCTRVGGWVGGRTLLLTSF